MSNLDPWINQNENVTTKTITNKFENHLLSIKDEHQKRIRPNLHPTIMNVIILIDNIIEELDENRDIARNKMKKAMLKDEVSIYC